MTAAAQEVAYKAATPASVAGAASAALQGDATSDTFDSLIGTSKFFQKHRGEQRAEFNRLKDELDTNIKNQKGELDTNTIDISCVRSQLGGVAASQCRIEDVISGV